MVGPGAAAVATPGDSVVDETQGPIHHQCDKHEVGQTVTVAVSMQPNHPNSTQPVAVVIGCGGSIETVVLSTQPPSQPYSMHEVVSRSGVFVGVGAGVVGERVVVSKQPPNQPYLRQEVVGSSEVMVEVVEVVEDVGTGVVVESRQPHHPGVWQVVVRVGLAVCEVLLLEVVVSEPLLSKYFQLKQSTHSSSEMQGGTLS